MKSAILLFLLCLLTFLCTSVRAQCPTGPVVLTTDAEVTDFFNEYPNCTNIQHDLRLEGSISNLAPFSDITDIAGDLIVIALSVDNLDGLAAIKNVSGNVFLQQMPLDNQLATVPLSWRTIGDGLFLEDLDLLKRLDALESLESVGRLALADNDFLVNLDGIAQVDIQAALLIANNAQLSECANNSICQAIDLNEVIISNNTGSCAGYFQLQAECLGNPTCPPGLVELTSNQEINDFEAAYPNCINLPGDLLVNNAATNLIPDGMLTVAGNVTVRGVIGLTDIDRFSLTGVGGDLLFETMSLGPDLANGIIPLQTVGGSLSLAGLGSLETVDALQNVTSLGGLFLGDLPAIVDIDGLTDVPVTDLLGIFNLDQFNGLGILDPLDLDGQTLTTLSIRDCAQLEELSALQGFTVTDDLRIQGNPNLEECNVDPVCTAIAADISIIQISNNATGCSSVAEVKTQCFPDLVALMAFYAATDGPNWTVNTGWADAAAGTNCTPCDGTWQGVTCLNGRVRALALRDNNLTGSIDIPELSLFTELSLLNLGFNNLSGGIPEQLFELPEISSVILGFNNFTGGIPDNVVEANGLGVLSLSGNENLGGTLPAGITNLTDLILLELANCGLTGTLPNATIGNMTELTTFIVSQNQLTGQLGGNFGLLTNLNILNVSQNQLSGPLPGIFDLFPNLRTLDLGGNEFIGPLSSSIYGAQNLDLLSVANNNLDGTISPEVRNLTNLRALSLTNNNFTGTAPRLDQSPLLTSYRIDLNQFSGPLADDLLSSTSLGTFTVSNNNLNGPLPEFLASSSQGLQNVSFRNNDFSGCYPLSYAALCGLSVSFTGNDQLPLGGSATGFDVNFCQNDDPCSASLPVVWQSFTAEPLGKQVRLEWRTASEENNAEFVVERLEGGTNWHSLGVMVATNLSEGDTYGFIDENPVAGDNYYRIRQVDVEGSFSISEVRLVTFGAVSTLAWPNPAGESLTIYSVEPDLGTLYDLGGRQVLQFEHLGGGAQVQRLGLKSGVYLLRMLGSTKVQRLIVR